MGQAPDKSIFIDTLRTKYPAEWAKCNAPNDDGSFIRKVVAELQTTQSEGKKWGLNAKRDGPSSDISKDIVAFYVGPTDRHVEAYDVIRGHEAAGASIGWNDVTNYGTIGQPGTARYVDVDGSGYDGTAPNPNPNPNPTPTPAMISITEAINRIQTKLGHTLSGAEAQRYGTRAVELGWDGGALIAESIVNQILAEINPVPAVSIPCTVSGPNSLFPIGTKITLTVG